MVSRRWRCLPRSIRSLVDGTFPDLELVLSYRFSHFWHSEGALASAGTTPSLFPPPRGSAHRCSGGFCEPVSDTFSAKPHLNSRLLDAAVPTAMVDG